MSEDTLAQLPAGWHADPHGRYESRYFDGERWTLNVRDSTGGVTRERDAPAAPPPVPAAPAPTAAPTLVAEPAPTVEEPTAAPAAATVVEPTAAPAAATVVEPTAAAAAAESAPVRRSGARLVAAVVALLLVVAAVAVVLLTRP